MLNKPAGDHFIRWGTKEARVTLIHTEDKSNYRFKTIRTRGKGKNLYEHSIEGEAGQTYAAFGNDVPDKIKAHLNVTEDNFQRQHDTPFWFAESAGEVNRQLNRIISLGLIDKITGDVASRIRSASTINKTLLSMKEEMEAELKSLSYIDDMKSDLKALERRQAKVNALNNSMYELGVFLKDLVRYKKQKNVPPSMKEVDAAKKEWEQTKKETYNLKESLSALESYRKEVLTWVAKCERLTVKRDRQTEGRCPLCQQPLKKQ